MNATPVILRELLVVARRRNLRRERILTAVVGGVILTPTVLILTLRGAGVAGGAGLGGLFAIAVFCCYFVAVSSTAESVVTEHQEGTLGLLYLSGLGSWDILLAKLAACLIRIAANLLAVVPVLTLPVMLGGVGPAQLALQTALLANVTFLAGATGLVLGCWFAKSRSWQSKAGALALLAAMIPLVAGWILHAAGYRKLAEYVGAISPAAALGVMHGSTQPLLVAVHLGAVHVSAWALLAVAAWRLPRLVEVTVIAQQPGFLRRPLARMPRWRGYDRLRDGNPYQWLANRVRPPWLLAWLLPACGVAGVGWLLWEMRKDGFLLQGGLCLIAGLHILLKYWTAAESVAVLSELRRTGALELLLTTGIRVSEVLTGHWRSTVGRMMPLLVCALTPNLGLLLGGLAGLFMTPGTLPLGDMILCALGTALVLLADCATLIWHAAWQTMSVRKLEQASARSVMMVLVLPWLAFAAFVSVFSIAGALFGWSGWGIWLPSTLRHFLAVWFAASAVLDAIILTRSRFKLLHQFRCRATQFFEQERKS